MVLLCMHECVLECTGSELPTDLLFDLQAARVEPATLLFLPCHLLAHIILGPASTPLSCMHFLLFSLSHTFSPSLDHKRTFSCSRFFSFIPLLHSYSLCLYIELAYPFCFPPFTQELHAPKMSLHDLSPCTSETRIAETWGVVAGESTDQREAVDNPRIKKKKRTMFEGVFNWGICYVWKGEIPGEEGRREAAVLFIFSDICKEWHFLTFLVSMLEWPKYRGEEAGSVSLCPSRVWVGGQVWDTTWSWTWESTNEISGKALQQTSVQKEFWKKFKSYM